MERALKIMLAFSCCVLGYALCFNPQSILPMDIECLDMVLSGVGFLLMMGAGLYGILKLARPLLYQWDEVGNPSGKR
jgi:hypothetical protein